jgi:hypothetical protein
LEEFWAETPGRDLEQGGRGRGEGRHWEETRLLDAAFFLLILCFAVSGIARYFAFSMQREIEQY